MLQAPLNPEELNAAQVMFRFLTPEQQLILLDLQDKIELCEGVNLDREIEGGISYEFWCDSCKKAYARMFVLLRRYYQKNVLKIFETVKQASRPPLRGYRQRKDDDENRDEYSV